ncbi:MAG: hypothetical protein NQU46_04580 [Methanolinea sp.]|nr:hypothetical protein [Methanolinea sp.]
MANREVDPIVKESCERRLFSKKYALVIACATTLVCFALGAGCLSVLTQTGGEGGPGAGDSSALRATLINQDADWGFSRGCTWETTFQVYNPGSAEEKNVYLHVELLNAGTGAVRDTKELFLGTVGPGEQRVVTIELDGECLRDYTVRAIPLTRAT